MVCKGVGEEQIRIWIEKIITNLNNNSDLNNFILKLCHMSHYQLNFSSLLIYDHFAFHFHLFMSSSLISLMRINLFNLLLLEKLELERFWINFGIYVCMFPVLYLSCLFHMFCQNMWEQKSMTTQRHIVKALKKFSRTATDNFVMTKMFFDDEWTWEWKKKYF